MLNDDPLSEGEIIIAEFFKENGIRFKSQYKISKLKHDFSSYRIADFYIPKYKMYVEFLGKWNCSEDERKRYREKMKAYAQNNIPCVYLYPDNLGPIEQIFNIRMIKELKRNNSYRELFKYRLHLLKEDRGGLFFWIPVSMLCLIFGDYTTDPDINSLYITIFLGILIYQVIRLFNGITKYFK